MDRRRRRRALARNGRERDAPAWPACLLVALAAAVVFPPAIASPDPVTVGEHVAAELETPHPYPAVVSDTPTLVWSDRIAFPEATYIAPHFARFELAPGDFAIVRSPDGVQRWRYEGLGRHGLGVTEEGFFATHIKGDTAIVELYTTTEASAYGFRIDFFGRGYSQQEIRRFWDKGLGDVMNLPKPPEDPGTDAICDVDDSLEAKCYESAEPEMYQRARAVVRLLKSGSAHCTGWLIGCEGHIMTNEHCIGSQAELNTIDFEFMAEGATCATDCRVALGCPGTIEASGGTLVRVDAPRDYSLVVPDTAVGGGTDLVATYGYLQLRSSGAVFDERMYIPQHPAGWGKRIAYESTNANDQSGFCEVTTDQPACTGGPPDRGYFCDTQGGSSGSPVLGYSDHRVIALHHCANCPNRGVPIEEVITDLGADLPACAICETPGDPSGLTALPDGDNRIALNWIAGTPPGATYDVHRAIGVCPQASYERIATGVVGTSYVDTTVSGGLDYAYVVSAVDASGGCVSGNSNCASAVTTGPCVEPPTFAGLESVTNAKTSTCRLDLAWSPATARCGGPVTYSVYRSTVAGFVPDLTNRIATGVTATAYNDGDSLVSETPYYYVVRAVDSSNAVEDGNLVERTGTPTGPGGGTQTLFADDFEVDRGWTFSAAGEWERGTPGGLGGTSYGNPDPTAAVSGTNVIGNDLTGDGDYVANLSGATATSPVIDCTGVTNVQLSFQRWLNVEQPSYDKAIVQVSADGTTWTNAWQNPSETTDTAWSLQTYDISAVADNQPAVQVRFRLDTDGSWQYSGWNVDDVEVTGFVASACATGSSCPENPLVDVTPDGPLVLCDGTTQTLTATLTGGTSPYTYQWTRDGVDVPGATAATYVAGDTGEHVYDCNVRGAGCADDVSDPAGTSVRWQAAPDFGGVTSVTDARNLTCTLDLTWDAATTPCTGPVTYSIYRDTVSPVATTAANRIAAGVAGLAYSDNADLVDSTSYHYVVRAVDESTGGEEGNVTELSAAPSGPGSGTQTLFSDDFEDTLNWGTWTVTTGPGPHTCGPWDRVTTGSQRPPNSAGLYALTDSDACGSGSSTSTILTSPAIDGSVAGIQTVTLEYDLYYNHYNGDDASAEVWDGTTWQVVWADTNADVNAHHSFDVTAHAAGNPAFQVRFNYQNASYDWWFAVDNVLVTADVHDVCETAPSAPAPDEASEMPMLTPLTAAVGAGTAVDFSYGPACSATAHAVYWGSASGPLTGLDWTGADCTENADGSGTFDPGTPPPGSFVYFVVTGMNAQGEGSYGNDSAGTPRPDAPAAIECTTYATTNHCTN